MGCPASQASHGEYLVEMRRSDGAERALEEAQKDTPDEPMAHYDLGLVREARGDAAGAIAEYEAEIARSQGVYQAHFNLAKLLAARGRTADAVAHFQRAVDANPRFSSGYLYLAKARLDADDLDGAEAAAIAGMKLK